jgi:hypothetical protein
VIFLSSLSLGCLTGILISFVAALGTDVFDMEKPVVFTYEEIFSATDGFSESSLLGHGTYGSVYYTLLRDQVCSCLLLFSITYISLHSESSVMDLNISRKLLLKE